MTNQKILEDVMHKIGRAVTSRYGVKSMLRQLNDLYRRYNTQLRGAVKGTETITFASDAEAPFTHTLPADFLEPYHIDPHAVWRPPSVFDDEEAGVYTIDQGLMQFVGAAGSTFTVKYFSRGKELVVVDTYETFVDDYDSDTQTESPEWDAEYHWLLVLSLATHLDNEYKMYEQDLADRAQLEKDLKRHSRVSQTSANPIIEGPQLRRSATERDAYAPDYCGKYYV